MSDPTRDVRVEGGAEAPPNFHTNPTLRALATGPDQHALTLGGDTPAGRPHTSPVQFPGYQLLGELGRGGMGVVYRARHAKLNRPVALKVILAGPHASEEEKARFRVEAEAVARLRHPNIVQVYDIGEHEGFEFIALELVEGPTLRRWQNGYPLAPREAVRLAVGIGRAIQHAHENGILHRDIKPANILLAIDKPQETGDTKQGQQEPASPAPDSGPLTPKVTDFGLAKPMEGGADLTITGMACGTPNYMAPELVRGSKRIGPAVDVYSFGAVLYEMLTGRPPFAGVTGGEVMEQILRAEPPTVRRVNPRVPRDLCVIAEKCLEKEPARRYASAAAAVEDLENFLAGRPIRARAVGPVERAVRWCRRNPVAATLLAVSSVGCAVTGALAVALANSAGVERAARAEADRERAAAEQARDDLREALARAETARQTAVTEKSAADAARAAAVQEKTVALAERRRAVVNLGLARAAIRSTLEQLGNHPRVREPDFRDFRTRLIRLAGDLRVKLAAHSGDDPEALVDLGEFAHWTGYLEYLNGNYVAAADHYLAAADTFRRWSLADADDPAPKARQAFSLTNAANAFYHAGKFADAEGRHRESVAILEAVAARHPRREYLLQLVRAYAPLCEALREQGRWPEGEVASRQFLRRAHELVRRHGEGPETDVLLANALQCRGQMLERTGKAGAAECFLVESLAVRSRIVAGTKGQPNHVADAARGRLVLADHLAARGRTDLALPLYARAAAMAEEAAKASPGATWFVITSAEAAVVLAEALRRAGKFPDAERHFDRAIARMEELTRQRLDQMEGRQVRDVLVRGMVGRAHLFNQTGRHKEAVALWGRLAEDDPNVQARWGHRTCVLFSHLFDKNRVAAIDGAEKLAAGSDVPAWVCCDLAKVWCRSAVLASADPDLSPADRAAEVERAFGKAVGLLGRAKSAGLFRDPAKVERFATDADFDPIRARFDPRR
jgi:tetratricopeptide (TPR) repeat protein